MREPSSTDTAKALITTIFRLRNSLSACLEMHANGVDTMWPTHARQLAEGSLALSLETPGPNVEEVHLAACLHSIDQAIAAKRVLQAAEKAAGTAALPDAHRHQEVELMKRADRDYEKALTTAKAEAHRGLGRVMERVPDAWDSEI